MASRLEEEVRLGAGVMLSIENCFGLLFNSFEGMEEKILSDSDGRYWYFFKKINSLGYDDLKMTSVYTIFVWTVHDMKLELYNVCLLVCSVQGKSNFVAYLNKSGSFVGFDFIS